MGTSLAEATQLLKGQRTSETRC